MTFESQGTKEDVLKQFLAERKVNYAVSMSGGANFKTDGGIPAMWIIGVDGKIIYAGRGGGEESIIEKELAKIKYPGLGKLEVNAKVVPAATKFGAKDYAGARAEAK